MKGLTYIFTSRNGDSFVVFIINGYIAQGIISYLKLRFKILSIRFFNIYRIYNSRRNKYKDYK